MHSDGRERFHYYRGPIVPSAEAKIGPRGWRGGEGKIKHMDDDDS